MLSTGMIRKIDDLGRIVVPVEIRRTMNLEKKDSLEIFVDDDRIILKRYLPKMSCQITGDVSDSNLVLADGKLVTAPEVATQIRDEIMSKITL